MSNSAIILQANIERLMLKNKLRLIPLSNKAKISKGLLWKLMTSEKPNPTLATLDAIAGALKVPTHVLLASKKGER